MTEQTYRDSTTPSGLEIRYHWAPKRKYEIGLEGDLASWQEVPSVTTVLEVLDKPALPWWGMTVGVAGVLDLFERGILRPHPNDKRHLIAPGAVGVGLAGFVVAGEDEVVRLLKQEKLTTNHIKSSAGERGQSAHDAFEIYMREGHKPDPEMFPPEERGYIVGLLEFLRDIELGAIEPESMEVTVGSLEHGYAGRYDVRFETHKPCMVVKRVTPKRGRQYVELPPGKFLGDLKTSKRVYDNHFLQLEGYEGASVECGYEPTQFRGVIHVHPGDPEDDKVYDGPHYEFVPSHAKHEDFLAVLGVHKAFERMKGRK